MAVQKAPKRLHLDRFEAGVLVGLFMLICALIFIFGVLVGYGMGPGAHGKAAVMNSHGNETANHDKSHAPDAHHANTHDDHGRAPAGQKDEADKPGEKLRRAARDSKQEALNEMVKGESKTKGEVPRSVLDAGAYLAQAPQVEERKPAAVQPPVEEKVEAPKLVKEPNRKLAGLFDKTATEGGFAPKKGEFTIQVASFSMEDEARSRVAVLRKAGFNDAYYNSYPGKHGETWYRVGVGSFQDHDWAKRTGGKLVGRGLVKDFVVKEIR